MKFVPSGTKFLPCILLVVLPCFAFGQNKTIPQKLIQFSETELAKIGEDPVITAAVQAQNNSGLTLERIKQIDEEWIASKRFTRFMLNLMSNDCALALLNYQFQHKFIVEAFATDNKGANVGQTVRTSDYWQGDEDKFKKAFNDGIGAIHYGKVEYDDSTDEIVVQVSVPVKKDGKAIGTITFSISLDRWERR